MKNYLRKIAKSANKDAGYKPQKNHYFLGSLPLGTVFETGTVKGILIKSSVNAQVQIFHVNTLNLDDESHANALIGKSIWSRATEVKIIKLGKIPKGVDEK
jgi:hypothetical protein